jgi:hypothetical protein
MSDPVQLYPTDSFGPDYLAQFNDVLDRFLPAAPGRILEWGAGYTTIELLKRLDDLGCRLFVTVDDNPEYMQEVLKGSDPRPWFRPVCEGLIGPRAGQEDPEVAYSTCPLMFADKFDFIYIDGRRRMECALIAAVLADEHTVVVLHDYRRGRYQPIRALFDIVEDGPAFRVMRPRPELLALVGTRAPDVLAAVRAANPAYPGLVVAECR